jgi:hypothetical protein
MVDLNILKKLRAKVNELGQILAGRDFFITFTTIENLIDELAKAIEDSNEGLEVVVVPELYDGLTAEQWKRVVDENFFVVVSDSGLDHAQSKETNINHWLILSEMRTKGVYIFIAGSTWAHCTVVRQPGHRQPNFGEKPDLPDDTRLLVKHRSGDVFPLYASQVDYWDIRGESDDIMEYTYYEPSN